MVVHIKIRKRWKRPARRKALVGVGDLLDNWPIGLCNRQADEPDGPWRLSWCFCVLDILYVWVFASCRYKDSGNN